MAHQLLQANHILSLSEGLHCILEHRPAALQNCDQPILCLKVQINELDPLVWLSIQPHEERFFWNDRDNQRLIAGLGEALFFTRSSQETRRDFINRVNELFKIQGSPEYLLGGFSFDEQISADWEGFGLGRFTLPRWFITAEEGKWHLNYYITQSKDYSPTPRASVQDFSWPSAVPDVTARTDSPDRTTWKNWVTDTTNKISEKKGAKAVLARRSSFHFGSKPDPLHILKTLKDQTQNSTIFLFQFNPHAVFLGATPERLYHRDHLKIETEAIAATRPRGHNPGEDQTLIASLASENKDKEEHQIVVDMIKETLKSICTQIDHSPAPDILTLKSGHHLLTQFSGELHADQGDQDIINNLHPTPAVAGHPTRWAIEQIQGKENFARGWYAAPVGLLGKNETEFYVAIRSGLLLENQLHLYSGAGIVKDSQPQAEWDEIENKIEQFRQLFPS